MNTILIIILTLIIFITLLVMTYILLYNKIQMANIRIEESQELINKELNNRYELIMNCKKTIEKNTKMDLTLFSEIEALKKTQVTSYVLEKKTRESIETIYLIKNDYPKIEEKKEFKEIIRKLNESDTKMNAAKSFYNKYNTKLIHTIKKFPANIVALNHGIKIRPYYEGEDMFNESDDGIKI